jgi:hypothetical protein
MRSLSQLLRPSDSRRISNLDDLVRHDENMVRMKSANQPEYVQATGEAHNQSGLVIDMQTAIRKRGKAWEFSTGVGEVPDNELTLAATDRLNRRLEGKLVTFESPNAPGRREWVYAKEKQAESLSMDEVNNELHQQAAAAVCIEPIRQAIGSYSQRTPLIDHGTAMRVSEEIVDGNLQVQQRFGTVQTAYRPKEIDRSKAR